MRSLSALQTNDVLGWEPWSSGYGRRDSCSQGCGFKSHRRLLDGRFSQIFVVKIVMFV